MKKFVVTYRPGALKAAARVTKIYADHGEKAEAYFAKVPSGLEHGRGLELPEPKPEVSEFVFKARERN